MNNSLKVGGLIMRGRDNSLTVRAESDRGDGSLVSLEDEKLLSAQGLPDPPRPVVGYRGHSAPIGAEGCG